MTTDMQAALDIARVGAEVVRKGFESRPEIRMKGAVDPVTAVDDAAEEAIVARIAELFPGEDVLGEESGGAGWDSDRVWIVDPLDGTVNFVHGIPHFSVSVAVWEEGAPVAGAVIDVVRGEEFAAARGEGAWLDGRRIGVTARETINECVLVTGFPYDRQERADSYARVVGAVLAEAQGIRRLGSAALDFAWVACGRFDGYWEYGLGPWDAAAGMLLVEEAGGVVTDHTGSRYRLDSPAVVAGHPDTQQRVRELVSAHLPPHLQ